MAEIQQKCDNRDNLVTTYFVEVVTALALMYQRFTRSVTTVTTFPRVHVRTHTRAHAHTGIRCHICHIVVKRSNTNALRCDNLSCLRLSQVVTVVTGLIFLNF